MTQSGFPAGSIMDRLFQLAPEEKAMIGNHLAGAIHSRGAATVEDFDQALAFVEREAQSFFARLHGGPFDGQEFRMPQSHSVGFSVPKPDREITSEEIAEATVLGHPLDLPVTNHSYVRRMGSPPPGPGEAGDFDYAGAAG